MATREMLRQMVTARPFRPYVIRLADGQSFTIRHPELVSCSANGRELQINTEDEGLVLVEMLLVTSMASLSSETTATRDDGA